MKRDGGVTRKKRSTSSDWASHEFKQLKGDRGITSVQSKGL